MNNLLQDVRYALRGFRKSLGFTLAAVFALALGIGANTAMFSVVNAVLLNSRALNSLKDPGRLVLLWETNPRLSAFIAEHVPVCLKNFLEWKKESHSFEGMAVFRDTSLNLTSAEDAAGRRPEHVNGAEASADLLPLLGVQPMLGRNFKPDEMKAGKRNVVILSDDLWKSRFQSDPQILGKALRADGVDYRIIGVLPPGFEMPAVGGGWDINQPKVWTPLDIDPGPEGLKARKLYVFGRLKPGVTLSQARAEMRVIGNRLERADPNLNTGFNIGVYGLAAEDVSADLRRSLWVLQIAVVFVLLIACANVANLLLTRAVQREKEIAVRVALGAARMRIVRQMLSESLLLSLFGGVAGLLLALAALRVVSVLAPHDVHGFHELRVDPVVLAFTILVTMAAGLLFGLAPALHGFRQSINEALGHGARAGGGTSNRMRGALVICEVALSFILLIGAGLMIRSMARVLGSDMGFRLDHLLTMQISLPNAKYSNEARVAAFDDRLLTELRQIPGVKIASLTTALPMRSISQSSYGLEGKTFKKGQEPITDTANVEDGYFEALGMTVYRGRTFVRQDLTAKPSVAVINRAFARQNWPHGDAVGKVVVLHGQHYSIIGIVDDERQFGPDSPGYSEIYVPDRAIQAPILIIRTIGDPLGMASAVKDRVWSIDSEQPVSDVDSMEHVLHDWIAPRRFSMTVLLNFAGIALVLAAVGLYGVLAYSVGLRTREIGVRVALGAEPQRIVRLILRQGLGLILVGVVAGLAGAFALTRFLESLIYGISAMDPATFTAVTALLVGVALLASYLPARRAARTDPVQALRIE